MKRKIITITGDPASGKTTVVDILAKKLNYETYSNGAYFRDLAKKNNMDVTSFGKYVETHPEIDKQIEKKTIQYAKEHDKLIIDARLGFYSVPDSFKIYLKVSSAVSAIRAFYDKNRKDSEKFNTLREHKENIKLRSNSERKRYLDIYGVDKNDLNNYDLVINTTRKQPEQVAEIILKKYKKFLNQK